MGLYYLIPIKVKKITLDLENILREVDDDIGGSYPSNDRL